MKPEQFTELAGRVRIINDLYVKHVGTSREEAVLEDAAQWLELIAPLLPMIAPLLGGAIRHRIERTEAERLRTEVDRLRHLVTELVHPAGPSLAAQVAANRVVSEVRHG